jgi:hypothetical protein
VPTRKRNRRIGPRRKHDAFLQLELKTVKEDLKACSDRVARMERTLKAVVNEVDRLHEKKRS